MRANKIVNWFLAGLGVMTTMAFVGATAGTLAWYAYVTRASLSFKGVSINSTELLQIGIRDDASNPRIKFDTDTLAAHNCVREGNIVWANPGSDIDQTIISGYLSNSLATSYVNSLIPVTTNSRLLTSTDAISLYKNPTASNPHSTLPAPTNNSYIELPLVFRIYNNENIPEGGKNLWLSRASAKMIGTTGKDITDALRVFSDDGATTSPKRYLISPSRDNGGDTIVAGALDLNGDGYYDTGLNDTLADPYETVYGDYTGTPTYSGIIGADTDFHDINETGSTGTDRSTFYSRHKQGNHTLSDYSGLTLGKAQYYGMGDVAPVYDSALGGFGDSGKVITVTDETTKIASLYLTIYLEGWDHAVIDEAAACRFNLGLTFEIE